jgi:2-C-methyl-D-erythritol 4-phosphate cytidylyltransferase
MRSPGPKALTLLLGRPLLAWAIQPILETGIFSTVLVACPPSGSDAVARALMEHVGSGAPVRVVTGGDTRQESVAHCLREVPIACDIVAIHDAARPLLTAGLVLDVLNRANETGAAIAAVPSKDTVKLATEAGVVSSTLERSQVWLVQTPQCFRHGLLVEAHERARREEYVGTDDAALVERTGAPVHIVMGSYENIKVTTPEDVSLCEEILRRRHFE